MQRSTGAYTMLSCLLPLRLPPRDSGLGEWSVREMQEEIADEFATDGIERGVLTNCIACRSFFL